MMTLETLPQSITIIGGGVIGLEFASFFSSVGVTVHIIEAGPRILPTENAQISQLIQKQLEEQGVNFHINTVLKGDDIQQSDEEVTFNLENPFSTEKVLVAIGRQVNTADLGLDNTKVVLNDKQMIETNEYMQNG